ncbi:MAG: nickel pincer cofactor biosynthesis protein LarB [Actinobacteria bacterium]|nr:MAG: nickel pincer cofactor biosynthesis protein LarB [Actinomycetota bacterium]
MTSRQQLEALLGEVAGRTLSPEDAADRLANLPVRDLVFARVDTHRELRQGAPEVILGEGKAPEQVAAIAVALVEAGASSVLVTRTDEYQRGAVRAALPDAEEHVSARAIWVEREPLDKHGEVLIVSAGTSDGPVVHEARIRAELLGTHVRVHEDVGVAGLHRLGPVIPDLDRADAVIVVAGMDGALASVVGGLAPCPVIGVPTSVGYGSAREGETALHAMLCSCADGLAVVGIDDGLGAGSVAARIARRAAVRA